MKVLDLAIGAGNKLLTLGSKHAPTLAIVGGSIAVVVGGVLACKATLKASEVIDIHRAQMEKVREASEKYPDSYTDKDRRLDKVRVYAGTTGRFAKLYGPAVGLVVIGFTAIFGGYGIIRKRYGYALAAVASLDEKFTKYRGKVIEEYGAEVDQKLISDSVETHEIDHVTVDENGELKTDKVEVICFDDFKEDDVTRLFMKTREDGSPNKMWEDNYLFAENYLTNLEHRYTYELQAGHINHVFLNELLKKTGQKETGFGHCYGVTRKPGCCVNLNITPFYKVFTGDDEQFPMMITVPTWKEYDEETGRWYYEHDEFEYQNFKNAYIEDDNNVGYILKFDIDTDENGVPKQIYTDVFGKTA